MDVTVRTGLRPGDIGRLIQLHGELYAQEYGWDWTFEAFVAHTFGQIAGRYDPARDRIWIVERGSDIVACIAIVGVEPDMAQLRWFLVHASVRGTGLGRMLIDNAIAFCRDAGYRRVFLWTTSSLTAAAHLYRTHGFRRTHHQDREQWGTRVTEERYELALDVRASGLSTVREPDAV